MSSIFNATTKEGRARIRSDMHQMTWPLGGTPFTNGQGIERLLDACKALEKDVAERDRRIAALEATVARLTAPVTKADARAFDKVMGDASVAISDEEHDAYGDIKAALTAFLERRMKG